MRKLLALTAIAMFAIMPLTACDKGETDEAAAAVEDAVDAVEEEAAEH